MTDKYTTKDINEMISKLKVLLLDEQQGVIQNTLKKDFYEEYKDFDTMTAWECFVDEINRIDAVIDLHDILAECDDEDLEVLLGYNKSLKEENEEFKNIFDDIVNQLDAEIGHPDSVYSIKVVVNPKMFKRIKEICK